MNSTTSSRYTLWFVHVHGHEKSLKLGGYRDQRCVCKNNCKQEVIGIVIHSTA